MQMKGLSQIAVGIPLYRNTKKTYRNPSVFQEISGIEKLSGQQAGEGWSITNFREKVFVSQYRKFL